MRLRMSSLRLELCGHEVMAGIVDMLRDKAESSKTAWKEQTLHAELEDCDIIVHHPHNLIVSRCAGKTFCIHAWSCEIFSSLKSEEVTRRILTSPVWTKYCDDYTNRSIRWQGNSGQAHDLWSGAGGDDPLLSSFSEMLLSMSVVLYICTDVEPDLILR